MPGWTWAELGPMVRDLDALYLNFISGFEMGLGTAQALRQGFSRPIYADFHSLLLGVQQDGVRRLQPLPGAADWALKVSAQDLERHTDKLVRGLILCSPCNPTGSVYTLSELRAIAAWARKHDVWIIADEIYRRIFYGEGAAPSFFDLPAEDTERLVMITGASKAYAMTGWRVGAAIAPPHVVKAMANLQSHTTSGANHPAQWAAVTAYNDPRVEQEVRRMVEVFARRRDRVVSRFRDEAPGIEFVEPHGAFYFFFRVDGIRDKDPVTGSLFCEQLMKQEGVALVPGAAFGDDRWVRLSYAVSDKELESALDRILRFTKALASARAA